MLEVKNLSKIYRPKNGAEVKALDDISLSFPETGMVFLLGKSGSGKSTLLNVCGGLDSPTGGEILVKGRSSKNFSQSDFDSYRNTFIGFIFQEYNILNEFSVEDNIALALELQGKPKDKEAVRKLLADVDLEGYAKRKPNTLSGGQKQRIAIARALIKNPEIIMADEPTGALDSATGKQVFETLKKLSRDKLIIVVSHDRDFAELYGDRIIELKDGKVLSDISKVQEKQQQLTKNVDAIGSILSIKQGAELNEQDFAQIKEFLKQSPSNVIIASGEKEVQSFKKVNRISDSGEREVFRDTAPSEKKQYRPEDSKFIRSRLPMRHAIKIGLSGLKTKPIRLFFTILLCTVAFVLFGLLSTMTLYNSEATFKQTMLESQHTIIKLEKSYRTYVTWYRQGVKENSYNYENEANFTDADIAKLKESYGAGVFGAVRVGLQYNIRTNSSQYWMSNIETVGTMDSKNTLYSTIRGAYPSADDEICISSYMANVLYNCKTYDESGNTVEFSSPDDVIGSTMQLRGRNYKITGIFDSGEISPKFDALLDTEAAADPNLRAELVNYLSDSLHFTIFVNDAALKDLTDGYDGWSPRDLYYRSIIIADINRDGGFSFPEYSNSYYSPLTSPESGTRFHYLNNATTLADNQALLPRDRFFDILLNYYYTLLEQLEPQDKNEEFIYNEEWEAKRQEISQFIETCYVLREGGTWIYNEETETSDFIPMTETEENAALQTALDGLDVDVNTLMKVVFQLRDNNTQSNIGDIQELQVGGYYSVTNDKEMYGETILYLSDSLYDTLWNEQRNSLEYYEEYSSKYVADPDAVFNRVFIPYDHSQEQTDALWELYSSEDYAEDDSRIRLASSFLYSLQSVDSMVKSLSEVFLYVGLVLAVFAALLFSNFISVSISQKKKDIGILRAVGAKSNDVFKIFFSESAVIAIICIGLSSIGTYIICGMLNKSMATGLGASLLVFGIGSFALLVAIAAITAVLATFLPVYMAAKKKPVDSIRSL